MIAKFYWTALATAKLIKMHEHYNSCQMFCLVVFRGQINVSMIVKYDAINLL